MRRTAKQRRARPGIALLPRWGTSFLSVFFILLSHGQAVKPIRPHAQASSLTRRAFHRKIPIQPFRSRAMKVLSTAERERRIVATLRALGNPARYRIARVLADRANCVCGELVDVLPLAQSTVSEHLKVLKEAGLVQGTIEGVNTCYCLAPEALQLLADDLRDLAEAARACRTGVAGDACAGACEGGDACAGACEGGDACAGACEGGDACAGACEGGTCC